MSIELNKDNNASPIENRAKAEKDHKLKILVWMFGILLVGALAYIVFAYNDHKEVEAFLVQEKLEIQGELAQMENQYSSMRINNDSLNSKLLLQQEYIAQMKDSVKDMKATVYMLYKYKKLVKRMKAEKRELFLLADSLDRMNQVLIAQRDQAEDKLQQQTVMTEKLADQNLELAKAVEKGSVLDVVNLSAEGVKVSSSGKISSTTRYRRADKIRVCMTLSRNKLTDIGEKSIYIRVATPNDVLLGSSVAGDHSFSINGEKMDYSSMTKVYYEQESLDVCVFADAQDGELVKGTYLIAVYSDDSFIGETEMYLK